MIPFFGKLACLREVQSTFCNVNDWKEDGNVPMEWDWTIYFKIIQIILPSLFLHQFLFTLARGKRRKCIVVFDNFFARMARVLLRSVMQEHFNRILREDMLSACNHIASLKAIECSIILHGSSLISILK